MISWLIYYGRVKEMPGSDIRVGEDLPCFFSLDKEGNVN